MLLLILPMPVYLLLPGQERLARFRAASPGRLVADRLSCRDRACCHGRAARNSKGGATSATAGISCAWCSSRWAFSFGASAAAGELRRSRRALTPAPPTTSDACAPLERPLAHSGQRGGCAPLHRAGNRIARTRTPRDHHHQSVLSGDRRGTGAWVSAGRNASRTWKAPCWIRICGIRRGASRWSRGA